MTLVVGLIFLGALYAVRYFLFKSKGGAISTSALQVSYIDSCTKVVLLEHNNKKHLLLISSKGKNLVLDTYSDQEKPN